MKQKVVIKVSMNCDKSRTRAMKIAVSAPGVTSVEIQGDGKNQIVVTGEGIDSTCLTMSIRKKVGFTELISVTPIPEKKPEEKKETKIDVKPMVLTPPPYQYQCQYGTPTPQIYWSEARSHDQDDSCTIM